MLRRLLVFVVCLTAAITTASAQTPPDNEIWYTTTDGKKAELCIGGDSFEENGWYFEITSHTYNNGLGIIHANKPIKAYGYEDVYYELILTGNNIKTITFPKCTEYFYHLNFSSCKNLRTIKCRYSSSDGRCLIKNGRLLGFVPGGLTKYTIPNSVTSIGEWAFSNCSSLKSITIPNSVTSIEYCAFKGCSSLTSITIPDSVTSIGDWAFHGCSSLKSITIPNSVTSIEYEAFDGCSSLKSITIPNSVTSIEIFAFSGCSNLTSITIPNSVTSIEYGAFWNCSSLTSITIPNSVTNIGNDAFKGCNIQSVIIDAVTGDTSYIEKVFGDNKIAGYTGKYASEDGRCLIVDGKLIDVVEHDLTTYTIPDGVVEIGNEAFANCTELTSITIPESVTSFGEVAFKDCSNLKSVKVANKDCYDYFKDKVANIAFYGANASADGRCLILDGELKIFIAKGITEYTIPESVTSFGDEAFKDCSNLRSVKVANKDCYDYFKDKVANIAFYGANASADGRCLIIDGKLERFSAKGITEYTIPESVTSIGKWTFSRCSSLTSITIPDSVTSIGDCAFLGCSSLTSIAIPNNVKSIGEYAFAYCSSLTSIKCLATTPPAISDLSIAETTMIYVPKEAVKAYKQDPKWSRHAKQIKRIK
ncbi:MAG: leucine-rich repeat domain-containing protein [Alistipes sp.]|nr:leucine-rich repeat domain-containing protein [Alistipes sp.]